jgi:tetratricopeptide (TPR) repeat protein
MKTEFMHLRALADLGDRRQAASMAEALQPKVEAVGYRPLLAELLELIAIGEAEQQHPTQAEPIVERSFMIAEASGDDVTAVRAASLLIYVVGYQLHRRNDAARWARHAYALLDKLGPGQSRLRAWILMNDATVLALAGEYERARVLIEESVRLKIQALGERHWDVGLSLVNLACLLNIVGAPREALAAADRAVAILDVPGTPDDASQLADLLTNRATALTALGRYDEAEREFARAFRIHPRDSGPPGMQLGDQLHGFGTLRVAQGRAAEAIPMLEDALKVREQTNSDATFTADTRFSLARALWDANRDRRRALALAASASVAYEKHRRTREETAVATWLVARPRTAKLSRARPRS